MAFSRTEYEFFEKLYMKRAEPMAKYAAARLSDAHSAQDAVQEAFITAQKKISELMRSENPEGWLMNVLKFKILHEERARARFIMAHEQMKHGAHQPAAGGFGDLNSLLLHGLLGEDEFELLRMVHVEGFSVKEAAEMKNISYDACRKRLREAKRRFAQCL